jgi:hypothetical protein
MKPGSKDRKYEILITGMELEELRKQTPQMVEAFGLDRRIENYQGKRPIGFYRWDIDCLVEVVMCALDDPAEYPDKNAGEYRAMKNLYEKLRKLNEEAFSE